jgi:hypothetical protein
VEDWRRLHNEELHNLYASPNIIQVIKSRKMRWSGHVACMGGMRNAYNILVRKPQGKGPVRRPRCRWKDNVRLDLWRKGCGGVDWIHLVQDRDQWQALVNTVMNLSVP